MEKLKTFVKKEIVLVVAWLLAAASAFLIPLGREYIDYIDFRSLGILWSLMVIVAGLQQNGLFDEIGSALLNRTGYLWQLMLLLVFLPFFLGMFITNDVALITFVPFAIYILKRSGQEKLLVPVVVFQTLAANMGSMLTPIGNPQNLYLYGISGMSIGEFILLMLPYTLISLLLILIGLMFLPGKKEKLQSEKEIAETGEDSLRMEKGLLQTVKGSLRTEGRSWQKEHTGKRKNIIYVFLFFMAVAAVAFPKLLPYPFLIALVLVVFLVCDRKVLLRVDYFLLLTFTGFFIFTGNLGKIAAVRDFMTSVTDGHEVFAAVGASQFISNVPAALLLSGFTKEIGKLVIGVNLGGLGTLIASMASLISFKLLSDAYPEKKGKYFLTFTGISLLFLAILLLVNKLIG